jgi:hypothetical protein
MDCAKVKDYVSRPKWVAGEEVPELPLREELKAQFSTVRNRKKPKKSLNDGEKQSSNEN